MPVWDDRIKQVSSTKGAYIDMAILKNGGQMYSLTRDRCEYPPRDDY